VSVLDVGEGVFEVRSTAGDSHLGGDDFDNKIVEWLVSEFKKDQGVDLTKDRASIQRLREAAERAKIELSSQTSVSINIPYITANESGPLHMDYNLTRAKFEELTRDLMERVKKPFQQALEDAKLHQRHLGPATRIVVDGERDELEQREHRVTDDPDIEHDARQPAHEEEAAQNDERENVRDESAPRRLAAELVGAGLSREKNVRPIVQLAG
jgi:hypothetical protein